MLEAGDHAPHGIQRLPARVFHHDALHGIGQIETNAEGYDEYKYAAEQLFLPHSEIVDGSHVDHLGKSISKPREYVNLKNEIKCIKNRRINAIDALSMLMEDIKQVKYKKLGKWV